MSKRQTSELLLDIKEAAKRISGYISGMSYPKFLDDQKTQDAVVRNIEIIGEAVKKLPETFRAQYPDMPWKEIAGTRDKLIHDYFGVNFDILWNISENEIPGIRTKIDKLLKIEGGR